ncbi:uncharacterized protein LOC103714075 [Phoenix dactylifera]|uniref:Uncharacterized protein LOC103714075 n=1 Tax=Phoenix dactylifera TaxID=42345 RepID=A0A8B8J887_PHODC|nr:uncharacterized protein LOC103714075 [Phoenix dactylifera]
MDTSFSLSSSSSFSSSLNASSSFFGSDANPSFPYTPSSLAGRRRGGDRETPRFFCESISAGAGAGGHHFLDACFLCKKPIAANGDIFMYRGDAPFCSEECREEQMEMDEALENNRKKFSSYSSSSSSSSSSSLKNSSSSVSSTIKRKPSLIIRPNSRNVHAVVAGY